jgi:hypothetical protein
MLMAPPGGQEGGILTAGEVFYKRRILFNGSAGVSATEPPSMRAAL